MYKLFSMESTTARSPSEREICEASCSSTTSKGTTICSANAKSTWCSTRFSTSSGSQAECCCATIRRIRNSSKNQLRASRSHSASHQVIRLQKSIHKRVYYKYNSTRILETYSKVIFSKICKFFKN
jgi:hypothetical protein